MEHNVYFATMQHGVKTYYETVYYISGGSSLGKGGPTTNC